MGGEDQDGSFVVKDSGERKEFASGMVRDTEEGKLDYSRVLDGPMFDRWAEHLSKGAVKYPDVQPGVANWTLAAGEEELTRFKKSALRHFLQWYRGERDEDHAAAVFFNINGAEYVEGTSVDAGRAAREAAARLAGQEARHDAETLDHLTDHTVPRYDDETHFSAKDFLDDPEGVPA